MIVARPDSAYEHAEADGKGRELRDPIRMPGTNHDMIIDERRRNGLK